MDNENIILHKSKAFAIRIIKLFQFLQDNQKEYHLSKQLIRSGTSIGANVREAVRGFSKSDFLYKMNISLKEANETAYWLELLYETDYITEQAFTSIYHDCDELIKLLTAIVKTSRESIKEQSM